MALPIIGALAFPTLTSDLVTGLSLGAAFLAKYGGEYFMVGDDYDSVDGSFSSVSPSSLTPSNLNDDFSSISTDLVALPSLVSTDLSALSSSIDEAVSSATLEKPTFEYTHLVSESISEAVTGDNLLDILKESGANRDLLSESSVKVLSNIAESIQVLTEQVSALTQVSSTMLSHNLKQSVYSQSQSVALSNNLPSIAHSLSLLPSIVKEMQISNQVSLASAKSDNFNSSVINSSLSRQAFATENQLSSIREQTSSIQAQADATILQVGKISELVDKEDIRNEYLSKTADLHDYELNQDIKLSDGTVMKPVEAKAIHNSEKAIETRSSNKLSVDDYLDMLDDADFNIFSEVIKKLKLGVDNANT